MPMDSRARRRITRMATAGFGVAAAFEWVVAHALICCIVDPARRKQNNGNTPGATVHFR